MLAIISHTFPTEAEETLLSLGHRTLRLPPHPNLPQPIASHPDMLLFFAPNAIFCTESYSKIATKELEEISAAYGAPIRHIEKEYGNTYPYDVPLNALPLEKQLFCNTKTVAQELLELDFVPSHVNQGYTKCSSLPLGSNALITSDATIAACAKKHDIDVLQICEGYISLAGYDHGFIGGCASFDPRGRMNTVFFCGNLSRHPDCEKINRFCCAHNFIVKSLFDADLCDVGTFFMI